MTDLRYVTHPNVVIDPDVAVPRWGLSDTGRMRTRAMSAQPWLDRVGTLICSDEQKAIDTAAIIGDLLGLEAEIRPHTHENERTGFLPPAAFDAMADRFFARPEVSADGWERAIDAQARILGALDDVIHGDHDHDVMVIGHGGVGTLLLCALAGWEIDRRHDQPGVGHHWCYDLAERRLVHGWRAIDSIDPA
ncbi:MAG: histidine phosphatase family protein [Actinomycetota bacterium]